MSSSDPYPRLALYFYCIIALVIAPLPLIGIPFNWLETVFHEFSHAYLTLLTGGEVMALRLYPSGAGEVLSQGGNHILIAFGGYFGAACWGWILYQASAGQRFSRMMIYVLILSMAAGLILWVDYLLTALILLMLVVLLLLLVRNVAGLWLSRLLQLMGILVLFNAIKSPIYLIDGQSRGDGAILARLTYIPEGIWVLLWWSWGVFLLFLIWYRCPDNKINLMS